MRLWDWRLIPYLPRTQLLGLWRELNSIFKKQDKHILINYVYEYPKSELYNYSIMVINEMANRGYKIKSMDNYNSIFTEPSSSIWFNPFKNHHTKRYLKQCFYNLQEKFDRGQKDFTIEQMWKLEDFVKKECGL